MNTPILEVYSRPMDIKAKSVRAEGLVPAVFYGANKENKFFQIDYQTFRKVFEKAGQNTVLELNIDGKDTTNVLVHKVDFDPVTDKFIHVDFVYVDMNKEVTTEVPLNFVGESKAVREMQGTLMQNRDVLTVKCLARNIPKTLEVDITPLEDFHSSIHVSDVKLPEGISVIEEENLTIATVVAQREEEEAVPVEAEATEETAKAEGNKGAANKEESSESKGEKAESK